MPGVHIVLSDEGWILQRLAKEIAERVPYVTYSLSPRPEADLQYYMTYSTWRRKLAEYEMAFFAHLEPEGEAYEKFFNVARSVGHCITMCQRYEDLLRESGVDHVTTVPPGVDVDKYEVRLKIGVVGRAYHTGRKGEALVSSLMDEPHIDWYFTGDGWPKEGLHLPDSGLPQFYRDMDYILVPALYEGGPMCVIESLASGTPVIAPPIGWVTDFPHVEYKTGDAGDLRAKLRGLVRERLEMREAALCQSWERWARGNQEVFEKMVPGLKGQGGPRPDKKAQVPEVGIQIFMHGNEGASKGGPSYRCDRTALELRELGGSARTKQFPVDWPEAETLVHSFNLWGPNTSLALAKATKRAGVPLVFSPIFLDLSQQRFYNIVLPDLFITYHDDPDTLEERLANFRDEVAEDKASGEVREPVPGYFAKAREAIGLADHAILLSQREADALSAIGALPGKYSIVKNPVDASLFAGGNPGLFRKTYGLDDFVLCVARIEPRKNQLMLAHALRGTGLKLVLVGHVGDARYYDLVIKAGGGDLLHIDRLPPQSPLLASAYAACRVYTLPSWAEGASLSVLEAAASGCNMVLSSASSEQEYFDGHARFCDPADVEGIRGQILRAWKKPLGKKAKKALQDFVREEYSWRKHVASTSRVYQQALDGYRPPAPPVLESRGGVGVVYYDLSTIGHKRGRWTGIARMEWQIAQAMADTSGIDLRFVVWNSTVCGFLPAPPLEELTPEALTFLATGDCRQCSRTSFAGWDLGLAPNDLVDFEEGACLVVQGSAWMQNPRYVESLVQAVSSHALELVFGIPDIIPVIHPGWMPPRYSQVFEAGLRSILGVASHVYAISETTKLDVEKFLRESMYQEKPVSTIVLGSDSLDLPFNGEEAGMGEDLHAMLEGKAFVLCVGAIHFRKNQILLYHAWNRLLDRFARGGKEPPMLVLVGGYAWNTKDVRNVIQGDTRLRPYLHILEGVSDEELDWLYGNCLFTVFPSLYEGWGLPVAESLGAGKLCLASDIGSVREIAPGLLPLLDPMDAQAWADSVAFYAGSRSSREEMEERIAKEYEKPKWSGTGVEMIGILEACRANPAGLLRELPVGMVVKGSDARVFTPFQGPGWYPSEGEGCWSSGNYAELRFRPAGYTCGPLKFEADIASLRRHNSAPQLVKVSVNGEFATVWSVVSEETRLYSLSLEDAEPGEEIRIGFYIQNPISPAHIKKESEDRRILGIRLKHFRLADPISAPLDDPVCGFPSVRDPFHIQLGETLEFMETGQIQQQVFPVAGRFLENWGYVPVDGWPLLSIGLGDPRVIEGEVSVEMEIVPVASQVNPVGGVFHVNGVGLGHYHFTASVPSRVSLRVPSSILKKSQPLLVSFAGSAPRSPRTLSVGRPDRPFVFSLRGLQVRKVDGPLMAPIANGVILPAGLTIDAGVPGKVLPYLGLGWQGWEDHVLWAAGGEANLWLKIEGELLGAKLLLRMAIFTKGSGSVHISCRGGESRFEAPEGEEAMPVYVELELEPIALEEEGLFHVEISSDGVEFGLARLALDEALVVDISGMATDIGLRRMIADIDPLLAFDGEWDEGRYLKINPDVADAVENGQLASGFQHYMLYGSNEGRTR